jgi:hypothetical protein
MNKPLVNCSTIVGHFLFNATAGQSFTYSKDGVTFVA